MSNIEPADDPEYYSFGSVTIGRHADAVGDSICTHAIKKELMVSQDDAYPALYVRVECDDCGVISNGMVCADDWESEELSESE